MYNKVEICGVNTSKLKTLSEDEKKELLLRSRQGDPDARRELIDGNLRLVLSIVQRFTNRKENLDDLFQVGCVGLIKAVDNFNTDLDVRFSTYAVPISVPRRKNGLHFYPYCDIITCMKKRFGEDYEKTAYYGL
jgi:RNA polymerase sporulation-specific sigma factor